MEEEKRRHRDHLKKRISAWGNDEDPLPPGGTNKWEITPRTATQSKRLKWDQTPLGLVKIEDDCVHRSRSAENRWDVGNMSETQLLKYAEMPLREINLCLPNKGYKKYNLEIGLEEAVESLTHTDLPEIKSEERDFFSPMFIAGNEAEIAIYRGLLLVKNGDSKMRRHGRRMLVRSKETNGILEKIVLLCMSLDLEVPEKARMVELVKELLGKNRDVGYKRELMFIMASYLDHRMLKKTVLECFGLFFGTGIEPLIEIFEEDASSPEPHIREAVSKVLGAYAVYHKLEGTRELLEALAANHRYEVRSTCVKALISIFVLLGLSVLPDLDFVLGLLSKLLLDTSRLIRVDACNAMSVLFNLIKPYRDTRTNGMFFLLKRQALGAHGMEFDAIVRTMSFLCIDNQDFAEITYKVLRAAGGKGSTEVKVFEKLCDKIEPDEAKEYFRSLLSAIFSQNMEIHKSFAISLCVSMCRHSEIPSAILGYYREPRLMDMVSDIFSRVSDLGDADTALYYESVLAALRGGSEVALRLLEPLVNKKSLRPKFVWMFIQEGARWFKSPEVATRIRGLVVVKELAMFMERRDIVYCGCILFESLGSPTRIFCVLC
jgi:splicing factor 3B subunit 1